MSRRKKPPMVPLQKCWITGWTALNACKLKCREINSPAPTSFPFQELTASPQPALLPHAHREKCLSFLTQYTQTGHVVKQLPDLRTESQNLFFWWNEAIKDISTLNGKRFYYPHFQIWYVIWSCSLSCSLSLPKPCLHSKNTDVLSCWITWFISICKIFIRASIEQSLGECNILQTGRPVAQKAEILCRRLSWWDKKTRNITLQFYLKTFPPSFLSSQGFTVSFLTRTNMIYLGK